MTDITGRPAAGRTLSALAGLAVAAACATTVLSTPAENATATRP